MARRAAAGYVGLDGAACGHDGRAIPAGRRAILTTGIDVPGV